MYFHVYVLGNAFQFIHSILNSNWNVSDGIIISMRVYLCGLCHGKVRMDKNPVKHWTKTLPQFWAFAKKPRIWKLTFQMTDLSVSVYIKIELNCPAKVSQCKSWKCTLLQKHVPLLYMISCFLFMAWLLQIPKY